MLDIGDIDTYLNKFIPAPRFERWPKWVARFLGYRNDSNRVGMTTNEILINWWILVSSFAGMIVIMVTFKYGPAFKNHGDPVPEIVPSWAASAILVFNAVESPLGQPRNAFFGTMLASLLGVCLMKLFMTNSDNEQYLWVCGALSVAVSSVAMRITKNVHPPAGAAALLPSVDATIRKLGWYYLLVQLLSTVLILGVACLMNNIQRRYPTYWWTPLDLASRRTQDSDPDPEQQAANAAGTGENSKDEEIADDKVGQYPQNHDHDHDPETIYITPSRWHVPKDVVLSQEEERVLMSLQLQLAKPET